MDNTNDWLASSYHNLLAQFRFVKFCGCFVMIKPMSKPFKLVVNFLFQQLKTQLSIYLIVTITIRSRKWIFLMSQIQHLTDFKTLKTLIFTEFMLNLHTEFLHFAIFFKGCSGFVEILTHTRDWCFQMLIDNGKLYLLDILRYIPLWDFTNQQGTVWSQLYPSNNDLLILKTPCEEIRPTSYIYI